VTPNGVNALLWRQDRTLNPKAIERAKVISLDVFDTLLFRGCGEPKALHEQMAQDAETRRHFADAAVAEWFPVLRAQAEAATRQRKLASHQTSEVTLNEIYAVLPGWIGDRTALQAAELAAEQRTILANPFLVSLLYDLSRQGRPVFLLSDMYLDGPQIATLLNAAGVPKTWTALLVSCEQGCSKADTGLFKRLFERCPGIRAEEILHIGDNVHGDVAMPQSLGIRTLAYRSGERHRAVVDHETTLDIWPDGPISTARQLASHQTSSGPDDGFWFDAGTSIYGPLVDTFARWVVVDSLALGLRRIAPFMREGAIFAEAMKRHARRIGADLDIKPLFVSRQSLYLASLETFDRKTLQRLASSSVFRTLCDLLHLVEDKVLPDELEPYRDRYMVDLVGLAVEGIPDISTRIFDFLLSPGKIAEIQLRMAEQRRLFLRHVEQEFGTGSDRIATVDLGARGSIQNLLLRIPELRPRFEAPHYLFYGIAQLGRSAVDGLQPRLFMPVDAISFERGQAIHRSPQFMEVVLNGPHGTTESYGESPEGRAYPIQGPLVGGPAQYERIAAVHTGIRSYMDLCDVLKDGLEISAADPALRRQVFNIAYRAVHLPTPEEAQRYGSLVYDYNDHQSAVRSIIDAPATEMAKNLLALGQPFALKSALLSRAAKLPWPQGTLTRLQPNHIEALCEGASMGYGHRLFCRLLIQQILEAGVNEVIVAAAGGEGGMGPVFVRLAQTAGLKLAGYLDHFPERASGLFYGVPVLSSATLADHPCRSFAIISTGYGRELRRSIDELLDAAGQEAKHFQLTMP
jgi:FMN phosphatase YigB (HAD superfamily)